MKLKFPLLSLISFWMICSCKNNPAQEETNHQIDSLNAANEDTMSNIFTAIDTFTYDSNYFPFDNWITDTIIFLRRSIEKSEDSLNPLFLDFKDPISKKTLATFDIVHENPYLKEGCELFQPSSNIGFYEANIPNKGNKNALNRLLTKDVTQYIADTNSYPVGYTSFRIDISSNQFASVGYSLDLAISEKGYPGFGGSRVFVFNSKGERIYAYKVNGLLSLDPCVTTDGKYLSIGYTKKPYWIQPQEGYFQIIRLSDSKIVYENVYAEVTDDQFNWLNVKRNMIVSCIIEAKKATLLCLDSDKDILYIKKNLERRIWIRNWIRDYLYLDFDNKPSEKLFFNKDFNIIHL